MNRSQSSKAEVRLSRSQNGTPSHPLTPISRGAGANALYGGSFVNSMQPRYLNNEFLGREEFVDVPVPPKHRFVPLDQKPILFQMSYQNAFAARTIQKHWRGYWARTSIWRWDGVMVHSRALKIQRAWRGRTGRKRALIQAKRRLANIANKIKGQYFIWLAKRKARVLRAEAIEIRVTMIQCLYRTRLARTAVARARHLHHTRMAIIIESLVRGRQGRLRYYGIKARLQAVSDRMASTMLRDIKQSQAKIKPTLQSLVSDTDRSSKWALMETTLFHIIGTIRRDISVDLASELVMKYHDFPHARFVLQIALFLTWTCSGPTKHVRMDMLEELVGCLYYNESVCDDVDDYNNMLEGRLTASPESLTYTKASRFGWQDDTMGQMDEIEFMYFRNALKRHGKCAHAMTVMAACTLMRIQVRDYDRERTKPQKKQLARAQRLLIGAAGLGSNNIEESKSRIEITENIFMKAHRILATKAITFKGLKMLGFEAWSLLHNTNKITLKDEMTLDIEICRCGVMVIIRGYFSKFPLTLAKLAKTRLHNNIPKFEIHAETGEEKGVDMAPKWTSYTQDYESKVAKPPNSARSNIGGGGKAGNELSGTRSTGRNSPSPLLAEIDVRPGSGTLVPLHRGMSIASNIVGADAGADDQPIGGRSMHDMLNNGAGAGAGDGDGDGNEDDGDDGALSPPLLQRMKSQASQGSYTRSNGSVGSGTSVENEADENIPVLVVRPLVLTQKEVVDMTEIAIHYTTEQVKETADVIRSRGALNVLAAYLLDQVRVSTCRSRLVISPDGGQVTSLKLTLPQIEYQRLEKSNGRTVDFSVKLIQRIYRGSRGKHRFRRMWFRMKERSRQSADLLNKRNELLAVRELRSKLISKVQAAVKAWSWRRLMTRMRAAALKIQCRFRIYRAKNIVDEERRRRDMGPEIVEMTRRSIKVDKLNFIIIVYRCGFQYRLRGYNLLNNAIYEGNVFQEEVKQLCFDFNARITGTTLADERKRISPWSYHKVTELMISLCGVAEATPSLTTTLGGIPATSVRKKYVLVMRPYATPLIAGVTTIHNLGRVLKDTAGVVEKYEKMLVKEARQRSQGLLSEHKGMIPDKPKRKKLKDIMAVGAPAPEK